MQLLKTYASRPGYVLPALVVLHWVLVAAFALSVKHNGWVWYQGGDQIWYTTSGWLLGQGELPPARVGYGWPLLLAPITLISGRDFVDAMPLVIALNVLVLGPIAIACIYWIARHLAGWVAGLWAASLWVALPYLAVPLFRDDYHDRFVEQFLPQALGLSGLADYPSTVCLLAAAALVLRALATRAPTDALLAGVVAGYGIGIKPANVLFLAGPALAFLLARRFRPALIFTAGLAPALLALAIWKARGLGSLPLFAAEEVHLAVGSGLTAISIEQYTDALNWDTFRGNMAGLREWFWSARMLQWAPFAGTLAVARRSLPAAGLLAGWFFAIVLVKGAAVDSTVESGSFFRFLMPAFPAYLLLLAFIPALVPTLLRRFPADVRVGPIRGVALGCALVLLAAVPVALVAFARPVERGERAVLINTILTPVDPDLAPRVEQQGAARTLTWDAPKTGSTNVFYRVFRTPTTARDLECVPHDGAGECALDMIELGTTRERSFRDGSPPPGVRYRIGAATNWRDDPAGGDVFAVSPPVRRG